MTLRAIELCNCGSPECQRCFPGNRYCECRCASGCECVTDCEGDECDDKPCSCPDVCRCEEECRCEAPEDEPEPDDDEPGDCGDRWAGEP